MIRIVLAGFLVCSLSGCSVPGSGSESKASYWIFEDLSEMVQVPTGSFIMGNSSGTSMAGEDAPIKTVSLSGFYMDETEVTNAKYKTFISWVRDKSLRVALAEKVEELFSGMTEEEISSVFSNIKNGTEKSIFNYAYLETDTSGLSEYRKYVLSKRLPSGIAKNINWEPKLYYGNEEDVVLPGKEYIEVMDRFMTYDTLTGEIGFNDQDLVYIYEGIRDEDMVDFPEKIKVYPDEKVWMKDFKYAYNEPMQETYFKHSSYDNYPVVGITWDQARAFCAFRTEQKDKYNKQKGLPEVPRFRLPNETEWEYAARGGVQGAAYPWGTASLESGGCFYANFKPKRGNYIADGSMYTNSVKMYQPNGYGLYGMAGNVSEWTSTVYDESAYVISSTMNPVTIVSEDAGSSLGRRVVRGGSWKDVAYYLRVSVRDYEYQTKPRSFIGFRTVRDLTPGKRRY